MRDIPYFMIFFPLNHALVDWFTPKNGTCPLSGLLLAGCGAGMTSAFLSMYCYLNWIEFFSSSSDSNGRAENTCAGSEGSEDEHFILEHAQVHCKEWGSACSVQRSIHAYLCTSSHVCYHDDCFWNPKASDFFSMRKCVFWLLIFYYLLL